MTDLHEIRKVSNEDISNASPLERLEVLTTRFPIGADVSIKALVKRPDLNGKVGHIVYYDTNVGRYGLDVIETLEHVRVRPDNLETICLFSPHLHVMTSLEDFTQPCVFDVSIDASVDKKREIYLEMCKGKRDDLKNSDDVVILPVMIPMQVFQSLPRNTVITPMYFQLRKHVCKQIDRELEALGMTYAILCTDWTDTTAETLLLQPRTPLKKGECRIRLMTEDDIKTRPEWRFKEDALNTKVPMRTYYTTKSCMGT